ncbi:hypothetical protein [Bacillus sp. OAE603]|uniref:hypothetical protein n=1 Tax=Gottfriedia sp. OAE603 TaxID=2663872 RepID=UPI00178BD29E
MRFILEIIRIIAIFTILGALFSGILQVIYTNLNVSISNQNGWVIGVSIFLLLFVLYRNKIQFSGWYNGKKMDKLSKKTTRLLVILSCCLLILPFIH